MAGSLSLLARETQYRESVLQACRNQASQPPPAPPPPPATSQKGDCRMFARMAAGLHQRSLNDQCGFKDRTRWTQNWPQLKDRCERGNWSVQRVSDELDGMSKDLLICQVKKGHSKTYYCQVWEHSSFEGKSWRMGPTRAPSVGDWWNERISSVRVGTECSLYVWENRNYGGQSTLYSPGDHKFVGKRWNDRISSLACECTGYDFEKDDRL